MSSHHSISPVPSAVGSPPITIVLTTILLVCFFVGFFSIYFCKCCMESIAAGWNLRRSPSGNPTNPNSTPGNEGLDPSLIQVFPTFAYSSVKDLRREKYGLECAICLGEFQDDDLLRLLTVCYHVFHQECIDLWFGSHKTCPVCRSDLDLPRETLEKNPVLDNTIININGENNSDNNSMHESHESNGATDHAICISIRGPGGEGGGQGRSGEEMANNGVNKKEDEEYEKMERFSRSHSTGHSIIAAREVEDKYTLRLLEHVKVKITRGHCTAGSCITFGDFSSPRNGGFGEVSGGNNNRV